MDRLKIKLQLGSLPSVYSNTFNDSAADGEIHEHSDFGLFLAILVFPGIKQTSFVD